MRVSGRQWSTHCPRHGRGVVSNYSEAQSALPSFSTTPLGGCWGVADPRGAPPLRLPPEVPGEALYADSGVCGTGLAPTSLLPGAALMRWRLAGVNDARLSSSGLQTNACSMGPALSQGKRAAISNTWVRCTRPGMGCVLTCVTWKHCGSACCCVL